MQKLKLTRILIYIITFIMLTGMSSFASPTDVDGTGFEEAVDTLGALGIMVGDADTGNFRPGDTITRKEFAAVICRIIGLGEEAKTNMDTPFMDVHIKDWASGSVKLASQLGIIRGYGNGRFGPEEPVTYEQAIKMLVSALGYEGYAQANGGYPTGYLVIAAQKGITKRADGTIGTPATRGIVAQMTYNALDVELMEQTGFGTEAKFSIVSDKTLLSEKLNCLKLEGIVTANEDTTLAGESYLKEDEIEIDRNIYKAGKTNAKDYLGYHVTFYIKEDKDSDESVIIAIRPEQKRNQLLEIAAEDIDTDQTDTTKLSYWKDKDNDEDLEEADISDNVYLIYNGKATGFTDESYIEPKSGTVKLIDNNNDDIYDVLVVSSYQTWVVDRVAAATHTIYGKYRSSDVLKLDPDSMEYTYTILKDGRETDITDIAEWDVLSVATSENSGEKLKTVIVVQKSITGTVSEIFGSNSDRRVYINDTSYKVSESFTSDIKVSDQGTYYLNIDGKIAGVNKSSAANNNFAILYDSALQQGISEVAEFKLFTSEGEFVIYQGAEKIEVNGEKKTGKVILSDLNIAVRQLISYELNGEGKISAINTPGGSDVQDALVMKNQYLNVDKDNNKILRFDKRTNSFAIAYLPFRTNSPAFFVDDETIIFEVPKTDLMDEDSYVAKKSRSYAEDDLCEIETYGFADDDATTNPSIIVEYTDYSSSGEAAKTQSLIVIDKITKSINKEGETVQKLYGYQSGEKIELEADAESVFDGLEKGDLIQAKKDQDGKVVSVSRNKENADAPANPNSIIFDVYPDENGMSQEEHINNQKVISGGQDTNRQIVTGDVYDINVKTNKVVVETAPIINQALQPKIQTIWDLSFNNLKVYLYDEKKDKVSVSSIDNISIGDVIVMRVNNDRVDDLVIYRFKSNGN